MEKIGETLALRVNGKGSVSMVTVQEQAIDWIAQSTLSTSLKEALE